MPGPLETTLLPPGVTARIVDGVNGLAMHVLEAGDPAAPLVLLLHGFPEIGFSWRHVLPRIAAAGFHAVAPDLRGYGRTTGWDARFDAPLEPFGVLNQLRDMLTLMARLGRTRAAAVVGHDSGSSLAAACALVRPDLFGSVTLMSAPFGGPPALPLVLPPDLDPALAALDPPRKHYHPYYATRTADADMVRAPQGLQAFLRAYYHHKSADWPGNRPHQLAGMTADVLAELPTYYVMDLPDTMAETVAPHMPTPAEVAACRWLPDAELAVYAAEYALTGFAGGLTWYRNRMSGHHARELSTFAGRTIDIPAQYVAGRQDWGTFQKPGDYEAMQTRVCTDFRGAHLIDRAGHWVQQEQPGAVSDLLLDMLRTA